jgi:ABC-2 type transport system permease protein
MPGHRTPGFFTHLALLWGLRLRIGLNRGAPGRWWLAVPAFVASSFPAVVLGSTFYQLMQLDEVASSNHWPDFIVRLLAFVTTAVWVTWPVLSAGVDDHSELSRYASFPISSLRLMLASTLASLFEPRALVFYAPLVGASVGYMVQSPPAHPVLVLLAFAAYVVLNASLSRVGLHLVLDVLRQQRSAQLIGGGFVVTLFLASFIPPVDTRWLLNLGKAGVEAVPDRVIADASLALGRFPTGWFAETLSFSRAESSLNNLAWLVEFCAITLVIAWGLLIDFHRQAGRGGVQSSKTRAANPFVGAPTLFAALVVREALDLWHNPRARLLAAVPFVLGILLRLLSGRDLFVFFLGQTADAWVLSGLSVYGAILLGSTFSQNAFAYDGHGFAVFVTAPLDLGLVLRAKNLVHALAGAGLALAAGVFYLAYFQSGTVLDAVVAALAVTTLIPALLTMGNFLSLYFPVKFHANLKRRDQLPFLASMLGVVGAGVGTWPLLTVLRACGKSGPTLLTLGQLALGALVAWLVYGLSLPWALAKLDERREFVLRAVTRE